jgi:hypothetical protein
MPESALSPSRSVVNTDDDAINEARLKVQAFVSFPLSYIFQCGKNAH